MELHALDDAAGFAEGGLGGVFGELVDCDGPILAFGGNGREVVAATVPGYVLDGVLDAYDDGRARVLLVWFGLGPFGGGLFL